ncbi:MAG: WYL domain-containing protein [Candidatus Baltobacteraceae bacterium]
MEASARSISDPGQNLNHPPSPAQRGKAERLIGVIRILELERKITKQRIYELLGVQSESSFKRIKAQLANAGLPITYNPHDKHFHVPPGASIARYGIDPRTRAQLAQVRAAVSALGGPIAEALDDVLEAFDARIAIGDSEGDAVVSSRHPQPRGGKTFYDALDRALSALRERRYVSFAYSRSDGTKTDWRTVAPYAVHAHNGRYYLWGVTEGESEPKLYALDRMSEVVIEDDGFEPDPGLTIDDALRYSFGTMIGDAKPERVVVRIEPEAAAFVRCRRWPAEVDACDEPEGAALLTFELTRFEEIVGWVLGFGGRATIISPSEARAALHAAANRVAEASR